MQFCTHSMAWKTSTIYFSVVIEPFQVNAQAAVGHCGLGSPGVDGVTISQKCLLSPSEASELLCEITLLV